MSDKNDPIYRKCFIELSYHLNYLRLMAAHASVMGALYRYQKAGYDPSELRDDQGRWTGEDGSGNVSSASSNTAVMAEKFLCG